MNSYRYHTPEVTWWCITSLEASPPLITRQLYSDKTGGMAETRQDIDTKALLTLNKTNLRNEAKKVISQLKWVSFWTFVFYFLNNFKIFLQPDTETFCKHKSLFSQEGVNIQLGPDWQIQMFRLPQTWNWFSLWKKPGLRNPERILTEST